VAAPSVGGGIPTDNGNFFNYSVVSNEGVLFEDELIQVGYQLGTQRELGRLILFYGNFSNDKLNLTTALSSEQIAVVPVGPLPSSLDGKRQAQQQLNISTQTEFIEPPLLKVNYGVGNRNFQKVLKLPLTINKFFSPLNLSEQDFLNLFRDSPAEKQVVVDTKAPANAQYVNQVLQEGFRMAIISGSWANTNVVAAATFHVANAAPVHVLVRMELSLTTPLYRITIRSASPNIATALISLLQVHFGAPTAV